MSWKFTALSLTACREPSDREHGGHGEHRSRGRRSKLPDEGGKPALRAPLVADDIRDGDEAA
jgi:hypothetical protein